MTSMHRSAIGAGVVFALLLTLVQVQPAHAQILYGGLVGNVTDSTEAAIPAATVTITNERTGNSRTAQTGASGVYRFSTIATGVYTLLVEIEGFRPYTKTGIPVTVNNLTRADVTMELGQVSEQITVEASSAVLQTDRAEVRAEVDTTTLENVPVPLGRNFQMLLQTVPGISPPRDAHSVPANPTRSVAYSVNGTSESNNNVRVDGVTSYNPNLTHMSGLNPALEAIEVVNVVTNSFDAEQGLAGGAAINVQIKSGTNDIHGSGFWYHNNQHLSAYPYFSDRSQVKPKFIYNQAGATVGGPIKENKLFYFVSYERTSEHSNATRFQKVPDAIMRTGDLSASPRAVYDPFSGAPFDPDNPKAYARDREPFPGNIVPKARISPQSQAILDIGDWYLPNQPGGGSLGLNNNYLSSIPYAFDRDQIDSKLTAHLSQKLSMFARFSYFYYDQNNPGAFGSLAGPQVHPTNSRAGYGFGPTYSGTVSATYVASPNLVFDGYFGVQLLDTNGGPDNAGVNMGSDIVGIPGTNPLPDDEFYGGMPRIRFDSGFGNLGYNNTSAFLGHDFLYQYVANGNWTKGSHDIRFGMDTFTTQINQRVANANGGDSPAGGFFFRDETTTVNGGPSGNDYNTIASFLLGTPKEAAQNILAVNRLQTRSAQYSLYVRDRWQALPNLTVSFGVRWEYYPFPTRPDRGVERYDFDTNEMLVCGLGSVPKDCGNSQSKKNFAPRVGIAWRLTDTLVVRSGYGITYDPFNLGRDLRGNYPTQFSRSLPVLDTRYFSTTLSEGLPPIPATPEGDRVPMPLTANLETADDNFDRGYIQSWNFTLEKQVADWLFSGGYVATRSVRQTSRYNTNYSDLGEGNSGRKLFQKFGRTANTLLYAHFGTAKYDALQLRGQKRFRGDYQLGLSYTWSHSRGYTTERGGATPRVAHPDYWWKNYGPLPQDIRHNFSASGVFELPFGKGKKFVQNGAGAAILGGWQINTLGSLRTGTPVTATAPGSTLNAPGSSQFADCIAPPVTLGEPTQWWSLDTFADPNTVSPGVPRFGTCGVGTLRGPGLVNFDFGVFRKFVITERVSVQFRAEAFNISNTPHFGNPTGAINSSNFGFVTGLQNTGREGIDQRFFRLGLRIGF